MNTNTNTNTIARRAPLAAGVAAFITAGAVLLGGGAANADEPDTSTQDVVEVGYNTLENGAGVTSSPIVIDPTWSVGGTIIVTPDTAPTDTADWDPVITSGLSTDDRIANAVTRLERLHAADRYLGLRNELTEVELFSSSWPESTKRIVAGNLERMAEYLEREASNPAVDDRYAPSMWTFFAM